MANLRDVYTKPEVFIIESLKLDDEQKDRWEGKFLSHILNLYEKSVIYYYIRTKREFEPILNCFQSYNYQFLHISCHGSSDALFTTLDSIPFPEFVRIIGPYLTNHRLFISACEAVNDNLASELFPHSECESLIGSAISISFPDAAITWAAFYHLVFQQDLTGMERFVILPALQQVVNAFKVPIRYYVRDFESDNQFKVQEIKPEE